MNVLSLLLEIIGEIFKVFGLHCMITFEKIKFVFRAAPQDYFNKKKKEFEIFSYRKLHT